MVFMGTEEKLNELKMNSENYFDAILMNSYNAGYKACNDILSDFAKQAMDAIEQDISPLDLPPEKNPFIDILIAYIMKEEKKEAKELVE